jgi:hypothetical protein
VQNDKLLYRKLFLVSIFLLLLNDLYLKDLFHNLLTGKLSDFVGLFAFSYFFSVLFEKKVKLTYILTGVLFIFWKSSSSQFVIDYFNDFGIGINRIVDYSDLLALLILPLSYRYRKQNLIGIKKIKFIPKPILIGICSFAFIATTLPTEYGNLNLKSDFETQINIPKDISLTQKLEVYQNNDAPKYYTAINIQNKRTRVTLSIIISELENDRINIKLDSILTYVTEASSLFSGVSKKDVEYVKSLKITDFEKLFIEQKINKLN